MERDKVILLRNIFFRAFVIGLLFAIFLFAITFAFWSTWNSWLFHLFKTDEKQFAGLVLHFFAAVRLILVFLFLVPGLALHWTAKKL